MSHSIDFYNDTLCFVLDVSNNMLINTISDSEHNLYTKISSPFIGFVLTANLSGAVFPDVSTIIDTPLHTLNQFNKITTTIENILRINGEIAQLDEFIPLKNNMEQFITIHCV